MKPAAIYIRVSTTEQAEGGESIPAQRERLRKWAEEHGYRVVQEYVDAGESARVADRPAFSRLIQDARRKDREWDAVLVWKWDRFARNAEDATLYKAMLRRECGVEVISISDPPGEGAVGQLIERILDVVAEFQSLVTAEHVHNTMTYLARQGKWLSRRPFGYRIGEDGKLVPDPEEAEVVRWMYEQVAKGVPRHQVFQQLIEGKPSPVALRRRWTLKMVTELLQSPTYMGAVRWNRQRVEVVRDRNGTSRRRAVKRGEDQWILVPNAHPAIVSQELWEAVQMELKRRYTPRRPATPWHWLRGLVRCDVCKGNMHNNTRGGKYAHDPMWECNRYYRSRPEEKCYPRQWIRTSELSEAVLKALEGIVKGVSIQPEEIVQPDEVAHNVERRLKDLRERKKRLLQAYLAGAVELEDLKEARGVIDAEIKQLESQRENPVDLKAAQRFLQQRAEALLDVLRRPPETDAERKAIEEAVRGVIWAVWVNRTKRTVRVQWRVYNAT